MQQAHVFISGFVQGVNFRHFVRKEAEKVGVTGWVRNTSDNRVEAVFQGSKEAIEKMIRFCRKGPFLAEVKNVEVVWEEEREQYTSFEIAP